MDLPKQIRLISEKLDHMNAAQKAEIKAAVAEERAEFLTRVEEIVTERLADAGTTPEEVKEIIDEIRGIVPDAGPTDPTKQNGVVGFTATGNATVSGKFECKNDSAEQMTILGGFYDVAVAAANAQSLGGVKLDGKLFATINGVPASLPIDNLHQLLKGEQAALKAALAVVEAQCAAEGIL